MMTGTVKFFLTAKGYGFIQPHDGGKDVMFHLSALEGKPIPAAGQWVQLSEVVAMPKGPKALKVALCKKRGEHERMSEREGNKGNKVIPFGTD